MSQVDPTANGSLDLIRSADALTFDEADEVYQLTYDPSVDDSSLAVIETVANISKTDAGELKPLHSVIDTGALDGLASGTQNDCRIEFQYAGFQITVESDGLVTCSAHREKSGENINE